MWTEVGFKVKYNVYDNAVSQQNRRAGEFHADSRAGSYRFDPDGWFSRQILSTGPATRTQSRFRNEKVDKLILEDRQTADKKKRLALYQEVDTLINEELKCLRQQAMALMGWRRSIRRAKRSISRHHLPAHRCEERGGRVTHT
jgi:ABC-type transport system substrate-binding protein